MSRLVSAYARYRVSRPRHGRWLVALLAAIAFLTEGCARPPRDPLEQHAREFVSLATAIGTYNPAEVDAYFGPPDLDRSKEQPAKPAELLEQARTLLAALTPTAVSSVREQRLKARVENLVSLLAVSAAAKPPLFADEARELYGLELPPADGETTQRLLKELGDLLTGTGTLAFRLAAFQNQLVIPPGKREAVFERALEECKRRTQAHWTLPRNDELIVEFTREVDSAWHRYQGNGRSQLQINPLAVAFVGAALDVACHEGYPGHHAQFLLFEASAPEGLPVEERVVLLRSADSVLREGAANYGVELVWTPEERLAFERDVLFPLAGLAPAQAEKAGQVHRILLELGNAALPILQEYRDNVISFNTATFRLEREAMVGSPKALLEFVDRHGAYVAGYTVASRRIREFIAAKVAAGAEAWAVLEEALVGPDTEVLRTSGVAAPATDAPTS